MAYRPYGHRREEEEEEYPPRGPPFYNAPPPQPPSHYNVYPQPPQTTHVSHSSHIGGDTYDYPPPSSNYPPPPQVTQVSHSSHIGGDAYDYPPPPSNYPYAPTHNSQVGGGYENSPYATSGPVHHASHESSLSEVDNNPHNFHPHMPSFIHQHEHQNNADMATKPSVRIFTKADPNYSLSIREGTVILALSNPSDPYQHWIKDEKFSTKVKDKQGYPSFSLVNKATGEAIKHSVGATHPVQLVPYNATKIDESVLWTESKDLGDTYRTIRMVNNIRLNVDAFNGDKNHGGVRDGTKIVLWEWKKGDNQRWKIAPY